MLKKLNLIILLCYLGIFSASAQMEEKTFNEKVKFPVELDYLLYKPDAYKSSKEDFPLIVFLHGAGERGSDLEKVKVHGPLHYIEEGNDIEAVILAPQCPEGSYWRAHQVYALIQKVIKENKIDTNRVYLTGLSMGGYGVWTTGGEYPELFAAMAPVCGPMYRPIYSNAQRLEDMPIWVFHGALDDVVNIEDSNDMVKNLQKAGNQQVKYTVYPFANHNSWSETYSNPKLYEWLLDQKKK